MIPHETASTFINGDHQKTHQNNQNVMDKSAFFDLKAPLSNPTPSPDPNVDIDNEQVCIPKKILKDFKESLT